MAGKKACGSRPGSGRPRGSKNKTPSGQKDGLMQRTLIDKPAAESGSTIVAAVAKEPPINTAGASSNVDQPPVSAVVEDGSNSEEWEPFTRVDKNAFNELLCGYRNPVEPVANKRISKIPSQKKSPVLLTEAEKWEKEYYTSSLAPFQSVRHDSNNPTGINQATLAKGFLSNVKSFWILAPSPVVLMSTDEFKGKQLLRSAFLLHDMFCWFPAAMFGRAGYPRCITCHVHDPSIVKVKAWSIPRSAVCADRIIKLIAPRYQCTTCNVTFTCFNSKVLCQYPAYIREEFPFITSHRKAISRDVMERFCDARVAAQTVNNFTKGLIGAHKRRWYTRALQYYSLSGVRYDEGIYGDAPDQFPEWDPAVQHHGLAISQDYVEAVFQKYYTKMKVIDDPHIIGNKITREVWLHRRQQFIDCTIAKLDISFKMAKMVVSRRFISRGSMHQHSNERAFDGMLTFFNEYEQVVLQVPMLSSSMEEAATIIKEMFVKRFLRHGYPIPKIIFSDQCCADRNFLLKIYSELGLIDHADGQSSKLAPLALPVSMRRRRLIIPYMGDAIATVAVDRIRDGMESQRRILGNKLIIGMDMQWNASRQNVTERIATVQFSLLNGEGFIFRISLRESPPVVPKALKALLEDVSVTKVAQASGVDIKMWGKSVSDVTISSCVNLGEFVTNSLPASQVEQLSLAGNSSLKRLVEALLPGSTVEEKHVSLCTDWEADVLGDTAELHGITQPYIALQVYKSVLDQSPVSHTPAPAEEDLPSNANVYLLSIDMQPIAIGHVAPSQGDRDSWGRYKLKTIQETRLVVIIDRALIPAACCLFPPEVGGSTKTVSDCVDQLVLWPIKKLRIFHGDVEEYVLPRRLDERVKTGEVVCLIEHFSAKDPEPPSSRLVEALPSSLPAGELPAAGTHVSDTASFAAGFRAGADKDVSASLLSSTESLPSKGERIHSIDWVEMFDNDEVRDGDINDVVDFLGDDDLDNEYEPLVPEPEDQINLDTMLVNKSEDIHVGLDVLHAMQRISRTLHKTHAAFFTFMVYLRDTLFMIDKEDLELLKEHLRVKRKMNTGDIRRELRSNWGLVLGNCRRTVPKKEVLLERFDTLVRTFRSIHDPNGGGAFFSKATHAAVSKLRAHILKGCVSDPDVPLYFLRIGTTKQGLPKYRGIRGTSDLEGYHMHFRHLFRVQRSVDVAQSILMEFNYRWDIDRAVDNRGLASALGYGFYEQYVIDEIQILTSSWYPTPVHSSWVNTYKFLDNGERFGLSAIGASASDANEGSGLLDVRPVRTPEEKQMFKENVARFLTHGGSSRTNPGGSLLDAAAMCLYWNEVVDSLHAAGGAGSGPGNIYKKSRTHINRYYNSLEKSAAQRAVMNPVIEMAGLEKLREDLRKAVPRSVTGSRMHVAQSTLIAPTSLLKMLPLPTHTSGAKGPADVSSLASHSIKRPRKSTSNVQLKQCSTCGHVKNGDANWRILHMGKEGVCNVPIAMRRSPPDCTCLEGYRQRKRNPHWHWCECGCQGTQHRDDDSLQQGEGKRPRISVNPFGVSTNVPAAPAPPSVRFGIVSVASTAPVSVVAPITSGITSPSVISVLEKSTTSVSAEKVSGPRNQYVYIDVDVIGEHEELSVEVNEEYRASGRCNSGPLQSFMNSVSSRSRSQRVRDVLEKKLLQTINSSGDQNPFNKDPFLEDLPSAELAWNPSYMKYVPYRIKDGVVKPTSSFEKRFPLSNLRWGHTTSEPARLAFWAKVTQDAVFRCRMVELLILIRENSRRTAGDGDCFYRSVLFSLALPATNRHLLEFKKTIGIYFEDNGARLDKQGRANDASVFKNLLKDYNKGWLSLGTNDKHDDFEHTFTSHGWGSSTDFFPHIIANRRMILNRVRPLVCISISTLSFDRLHPESSTKLFVEGTGEATGKVNEATVPLWIAVAYILLLHDDPYSGFNLRTDLSAVLWKPGHFSHVLPCTTFEMQ